jgi:hypothetical protein
MKTSNGEFCTRWLQLAIYLHASNRLPYVKTALGPDGMSRFYFSDKDDQSSGLELEFSQGARVPATSLFASQNFMRREMQAAKLLGDQSNVNNFHQSCR